LKKSVVKEFLKELSKIFSENLILEEEELSVFGYDASSITGVPLAVVFPRSEEDVIEVMKLVQRFKVPVTCRGAGTSTTGSCVPQTKHLVISFSKMDRILEVNPEDRIAIVQPGVLNGTLKAYVKKFGLFYPPDPASYAYSTIGGNVATGAGGPKGLKYGTTKDYVLGLRVVFPGGKVFQTAPYTLKAAVCYNLTPIFVGSEGTLGVFTEIALKLLPLPEKRALFLIGLEDEFKGLEIISEVLLSGITPSSAEFVDKTSLKAVLNSRYGERVKKVFPSEKLEGLLFIEIDGIEEEVKKQFERLKDVLKVENRMLLVAEKEDEIEVLWEIRRTVSPAVRSLGKIKLSDDVVVRRSKMAEFLRWIREIEAESEIYICAFGHAGDGNFHINIMCEDDKLELAKEVRKRVLKKVIELRGTISGEHGIGYTKREFLNFELDPFQIEVMKKIKKIFDPEGLLNPGIKFSNGNIFQG